MIQVNKWSAIFGSVLAASSASVIVAALIIIVQPQGCLSYEIAHNGDAKTVWHPLNSEFCQGIASAELTKENVKMTSEAKIDFLEKDDLVKVKDGEIDKLKKEVQTLSGLKSQNEVTKERISMLELDLKKAVTDRDKAQQELNESKLYYQKQLAGLKIVVTPDESQKVESKINSMIRPPFIELNKKIYTWTDKVYITISDTASNQNPNEIEMIGTHEGRAIIISTEKGGEIRYSLNETGPNTGIFAGYVTLSGFAPSIDANNDGDVSDTNGKTYGLGPTGGFIAAGQEDYIKVSYQFNADMIVTGSALIRWNIGEIHFDRDSYQVNEKTVIRVKDLDLNLNPEKKDLVVIKISSDSDKDGISANLIETGEASGIFEGKIGFTLNEKSSQNLLGVSFGDKITATYFDRTLPKPYSVGESLDITTTAQIKKTLTP